MSAFPIVVLISGRGSNLLSIVEQRARIGVTIAAVISNNPEAPGIALAANAGLETVVIAHAHYPDRTKFDQDLSAAIDRYSPRLVVLAGFMRILGDAFVARYRGRLINIHPSLLPRFPGLDTHQRAIDANAQEHGATVHFVTGELDGGPVIARARVPVLADDDAASLAARVLEREHALLPSVIEWFASGRIALQGETVMLDNEPYLDTP